MTERCADFICTLALETSCEGCARVCHTLGMAKVIVVITVLCMIAFYATSFDSIVYTAACYSYK